MLTQTASDSALHRTALVLQKWGRMANYRDHRTLAGALYRAALMLDGGLTFARRELAKARPRKAGDLPHLSAVIMGTTGTCNASCIHCPTGKASTAHSPRGTMPMDIFRKVIDGIVEEGLSIDSHIAFGLFGDGLVDPLVLERARYLRERLPDALFSVNTNGAAYNSAKHAALYEHVTLISLHCESLTPATYDYLMTPLRAKNVFPKYEKILKDFPGKVRISVPVSRANMDELATMRDWFMERGAHEVVFDPMASRCMEDRSLFDRLSLAPARVRCTGSSTATARWWCAATISRANGRSAISRWRASGRHWRASRAANLRGRWRKGGMTTSRSAPVASAMCARRPSRSIIPSRTSLADRPVGAPSGRALCLVNA